MAWSTSRSPQPPPVHRPVTLRLQQRQARRRVIARIFIVTLLAILLPVVLAFIVVLSIGRSDRPATVPPDFRPPAALPVAARALPLDNMLFASDQTGTFGIYAMRSDGQNQRAVSADPEFDAWGVRLSPDRLTAVFYRAPAGDANRDPARAGLWAVASDGSGEPVLLRPAGLDGWVVQSHAEWDVYGSSLVMYGGTRDDSKLYVTDTLGQSPRLLTDRPGPMTDPSFRAPDGQEVFFVGCPLGGCEPADRELYRVPANGAGEAVRLTNDRKRDREPHVSPEGNQVAWLSFESTPVGEGWQLRIADIENGALTHPRSLLAMYGEEFVGRPQWSLDGSTIYVHRQPAGRATSGIFAISLTTTAAPRELTLGTPGNHEDPSL